MKIPKLVLAVALTLVGASVAKAQTTVYITGATAYRSAAVAAIENLYGGPGFFGVAYGDSGANEGASNHVAFTGNIAGLGVVNVKCCWAGSVGGLRIIADSSTNITDQPGARGWIKDADIPATGSAVITEATYSFDTTSKAHAAFSDAFATTVGVTGLTGIGNTNGNVGVVPFEWVANNGVTDVTAITVATGGYAIGATVINYSAVSGSPLAVGQIIGGPGIAPGTTVTAFTGTTVTISAPTTAAAATGKVISSATVGTNPITNMDALKYRSIMANGGAYLSMFTGVAAATNADNVFVYALGRNRDSGTRVSVLSETGFGLTGNPQHVQPTITGGGANGAGGSPARKIASMARWPSEAPLFGQTNPIGSSGYSSGGNLADALSSWGSVGAATTAGGVAVAFQSKVGVDGGWLVAYLSRGDAKRATAQTNGANTARRITWNGEKDWKGTDFKHDGDPVDGYDDAAIQEGRYTAWEFEHFYKNTAATNDANVNTYLTNLFNGIQAVDPGIANIPLNSMHVTRVNEGAPINHNTTP